MEGKEGAVKGKGVEGEEGVNLLQDATGSVCVTPLKVFIST